MIHYSNILLRNAKMLNKVTHNLGVIFYLHHIYIQIWVIKLSNFTMYLFKTLKLKVFNIKIITLFDIVL